MADADPAAPRPLATELGRLRLALLALASMVAPAVLVIQVRVDGEVADLTVVAALSACTFLLVLARMAGIMASHRLALARERGLREASAALVSAADADEVGDAVRRAVAQLLPADVPHRVVLAMAIAEPEERGLTRGRRAGRPRTGPPAPPPAWSPPATSTGRSRCGSPSSTWCCAARWCCGTGRPATRWSACCTSAARPGRCSGCSTPLEVLAGQVALALERIALSHEVTRRNSETYFRTLVQNTSDVILIVDDEDRIRYASPSRRARPRRRPDRRARCPT